ncbi:serine protease [Burkholderia cepacia]|uniref:S1 family peptidase n=1 Tax=Burkholderia cepacia TaxID=292 RepID=UPI002FE31791
MIHKLSRATTYLQTFVINPSTGEHKLRSYATGFFIRATNALLLVTNWHVVTGLNPADPSLSSIPPPHYLKATVIGKHGFVTELSLPLYGSSMTPLWEEHPSGSDVDIAIYPLPFTLENHFDFIDIHSAEDDAVIAEKVARDVFILGYPFSRDEMRDVFGEDAPYYIPVWKRGSIATEPALRLGRRILLIDSLSRAGMSGAPIVIAQDDKLLGAGNAANSDVFRCMLSGESSALDVIRQIDTDALTEETVKRFRFLGVYSGTIGSTRLSEIALGKCWHAETLRDLVENAQRGAMPYHAPVQNEHYDAFFAQFAGGELTLRSVDGKVVEKTRLYE